MAIMVNEESSHKTSQEHRGVTPTDKDVLLGKGTPINNHAGNKNFRRLIKLNHTKYDNEPEGNKYLVARAIVDSLYNEGSRFLKKSDGVWQEVEKKRAYGKAQQTLRDGAPKRREKKYKLLLKEKLQEDQQAEHKSTSSQPSSLRSSTPPPQYSLETTAPVVVSPIASPTSFLSFEHSTAISLPSASTPEDSHGEATSHRDFPAECAFDSWAQYVDTSVREEELEAIMLQPDALFGLFLGNEQGCQQAQDLEASDSMSVLDVTEPLPVGDSDSDDDDWFGEVRLSFLAEC